MIRTTNYSEFATLAQCETKWVYGYILGQDEEGEKRGLHKGTLLHLAGDRWLRGEGATLPEQWTDDINTGGKPGEERTLLLSDFDPSVVEEVEWLLERWTAFYGSEPPSSWNVISSEEWLRTTLPSGLQVVGRTDGIIEIDGNIWLRELKSYGSKGRLDTINVEPQLSIYFELVKAKYGEYPFGILFDGIYTYQWALKKPTQAKLIEDAKKGFMGVSVQPDWTTKQWTEWARQAVADHPGVQEHPPEDSFQREWVDRTPAALAVSHLYLEAAHQRMNVIAAGTQYNAEVALEQAIPNVGTGCNWCGFKDKCWSRLLGEPERVEWASDPEDE